MAANIYTGDVRFEAATPDNSVHTGDVMLEAIADGVGYVPGAEISTDAFHLTSSSAYEVAGLTVGNWYCIESWNGYWRLGAFWPLVMSVFRVSDGSGLAGNIGQSVLGDRTTVYDGVTYPAWCAFAECFDSTVDGKRYGRVYFQAPATSVYTGMIADSNYADNSGSLSWRLRYATYTSPINTGAVTLEA